MKTLKEILFINETSEGTWTISWCKPGFQSSEGEEEEISEEDAKKVMAMLAQ